MGARPLATRHVLVLLPVLLSIVTALFVAYAKNFVIVWDNNDIKKDNHDFGSNRVEYDMSDEMDNRKGLFEFIDLPKPILEWDEFGDTKENKEDMFDPGSWIHILEYKDRDEQPNEVHEEVVVLYAELAGVATTSFISSKDTPLMEPMRLNLC